jgi:LysR family glycine cleavage system transcriptional activator
MRRYLPSTMMLQAFEASAKRLSFTLAAEDLCLTQSAVSKQVIALEEMLRTELFKRIRKRFELTAAGRSFQARISPALNGIEAAVIELMSCQSDRSTLDLGVVPFFANKWLIPRLGQFAQAQPGITVWQPGWCRSTSAKRRWMPPSISASRTGLVRSAIT